MKRLFSVEDSLCLSTPPWVLENQDRQVATAASCAMINPVYSGLLPPVFIDNLTLQGFIILCLLHYLSPQEVGRLSRVTKSVHHALSHPGENGLSLLEKNHDITHCSAYKAPSQTLDLAAPFLKIPYSQFIETVLFLLKKYPAWATSQIKTLVFSSKTLGQVGIDLALEKLVSLLPGVRHLRLSLQAEHTFAPGYTGIDMYEQLTIFKRLPLEKITFENSAYTFPSLLHNAINQGVFSEHIECFAFVIKNGPLYPRPFNCNFSFTKEHYPKLHTLDFSQGPPFCLTQLPPTINCLRISPYIQISGTASTISQLAIIYPPNLIATVPLPSIVELPGLKEIYAIPPTNPLCHKIALEHLLTLTFPPPVAIKFPNLHIDNPLLLASLCEKFAGNICIQNQVTFHIHDKEETDNVVILAKNTLFDHLHSIHYQLDSFAISPLFFYQTIVDLWGGGRFTSLDHLAITYYDSPAAKARQENAISAPGSAYFIDTALGKEIYANIKQPYRHTLSLRQFLKHNDLTPSLIAFNVIEPRIRVAMYGSTIDNDKIKNTFLTLLQQAFQHHLINYQALLHEIHPWEIWVRVLEKLHTELYQIYLQHLQNFSGLFAPDTSFLLPEFFYQTELGKIVALRTQHYFFTAIASLVIGRMGALPNEYQFKSSYTVLPEGFNIDLFKQ